MFGHKQSQQTHRQQFMNEMNESVGALRRAAGHFALGAAERMTPTYDRARNVAGRGWDSTRQSLTPIYQQVREGASTARSPKQLKAKAMAKSKKNGHSRLRGFASLLAAGAAVGAAGAAVARRRRAQQAEWDEYDPVTGESRYLGSAYGDRSARERVAAGAATMADSLSDRAGRIADSLHDRQESMQEQRMGPASSGPMTGPMTGPSGTGPSGTGPGMPPGAVLSPGTPTSPRGDRPGDPALGFPDKQP